MSEEERRPRSVFSERDARQEQIIAAFEDAWREGKRPRIHDYLAAEGAERQAILVELIHVEMERRDHSGENCRVEEYLREFPELAADGETVADLAFWEYTLRRRREPELALAEYVQRFPQQEQVLEDRWQRGFPNSDSSEPNAGESQPRREQDSLIGTTIGPYRLLEEIGEGGMGVVYVAEQREPVQRRLALKIIKPGMDTREVVARFEAERQALALMDHPHVAHVYDAGATETGRPYFVMELIQGVPITEYCDRHRLSPRERLQLFVPLCQALQHAHQKGIIHRDIKPTNILVAVQDGVPVPKIIDFGVAKAVHQRLTERTVFTRRGALLGTPLYMSPEQAEMGGLNVDTRTDIYSLGVVLYELLTGATPFDKERLLGAGYDQICSIIREEEPAKPSTKITSLGPAGTDVSALRRTDPAKLSVLLRGELDWIVMKSLEKDRTRRYETAGDFGRDVERYLNDEPVHACPPSRAYRFSKFARRNKTLLLAWTGVTLALVVGTAVAGWQAIKATRAGRVAEAARTETELSLETAIQAVNQMLTRVGNERLANIPQMEQVQRELLEDAVTFCDRLLERNPGPRVRGQTALTYRLLGNRYNALAEYGKAKAYYERARSLGEELVRSGEGQPEDANSLATTYGNMGSLYGKLGDQQMAHEYARKAIRVSSALAEKYPHDYAHRHRAAWSVGMLGWLLKSADRCPEAIEAYEKAIQIDEQLVADFPERMEAQEDLASDYVNLGNLLTATKQYAESEAMLLKALSSCEKLVRGDPQNKYHRVALGSVHNDLGLLYRSTRKLQQAEEQLRLAAEIRKDLVADFPSTTVYRDRYARTMFELGQLLTNRGDAFDEAAAVLREAVDAYEHLTRTAPEDSTYRDQLSRSCCNLGVAFLHLHRFSDAEQAYRAGISSQSKLVAEFPDAVHLQLPLAILWMDLGTVLWNTGRLDEAIHAQQESIRLLHEITTTSPGQTLRVNQLEVYYGSLSYVQRLRGNFEEAEQSCRTAMSLNEEQAVSAPHDPKYKVNLGGEWRELGWLQMSTGRLAEAEVALGKARQLHEASLGVLSEQTELLIELARDYAYLGQLRQRQLQRDEAVLAFETAVRHFEHLLVVDPNEPDYQAEAADGRAQLAVLLSTPAAEDILAAATKTLEELVAEYPAVVDYKVRLADCLVAHGIRLAAAAKSREAADAYDRARTILEALLAANPNVPENQGRLGTVQRHLAEIQAAAGQWEPAQETLGQAVAAHTLSLTLNPRDEKVRAELARDHALLVTLHTSQGDADAALATAQQIISDPPEYPQDAYDVARQLAGCVAQIKTRGEAADDNWNEVQSTCTTIAIQLLCRARDLGMNDVALLRDEPDFVAIRTDPGFGELVTALGNASPPDAP